MDVNILRIKINGEGLIKLSTQHRKRDFLISYPLAFTGNVQLQSHFTLHTPNGRLTFKTTSIHVDKKEVLPQLLIAVKNHPLYKDKVNPSNLDLYGKKILNLDDPKEIVYAGTIALNLENSEGERFFKKTKTSDSKFRYIKDIKTPPNEPSKVTVKFGFGKNFIGDLSSLIKKYDDHIILQEKNYESIKYTIVFFIKYGFPRLSKRPKGRYCSF